MASISFEVETIFALSSARGKAGVAVFRLSGPQSKAVLRALSGNIPKPRVLTCARLQIPEEGKLIDNALVVFFPAPKSFTGEDVVEIHAHGSVAIANLLFETVLKFHNVRLAEPGEFTKRAFFNGRIGLVEAEGLADLIDAETIAQHDQAIRQSQGELGNLYRSWKEKLLGVLALLEGTIDFADDEVPSFALPDAISKIEELKTEIKAHLNDQRRGERLRNGIKLGIFGKPNVGKSSLMNLLSQREVSITSAIPGTTRDVLESHLNIGGFPIVLFDTAGIRSATADMVEKAGINKAVELFTQCDVKILLLEAADLNPPAELSQIIDEGTILAVNKADLARPESSNLICISCKTGEGLNELVDQVVRRAQNFSPPDGEMALTRSRHRKNIELALKHLNAATNSIQPVLVAEEVRSATNCLKALIGEVSTDEVLGVIFANFCIGK